MKVLKNHPAMGDFRTAVMHFLNEFGLEAPAILSIARRSELVQFVPDEDVLVQGEQNEFIYFLVSGKIKISLKAHNRIETIGERGPVTMLGEISYFNGTPSSATVHVEPGGTAKFLRLPYPEFTKVIEEFPQIQPTLARIGDLRVISQRDGFASYSFFMDMIGWKRDRLGVNWALFSHLEETIGNVLLPRLDAQDRILDVGDGPGIICEVIHERKPHWLDNLYLQATHLEEAIINPLNSYPSDLDRAKFLREKFQAITALQIFDHLSPDTVGKQFELAGHLLEDNGFLLVLKLRVVDVSHAGGKVDSTLVFKELRRLVEKRWPHILDEGEELITVSFVDADIDPSMEWNDKFCKLVARNKLKPPPRMESVEGALLTVLMKQARNRVFNPEEIQFRWLAWHASHHQFVLESSRQIPEVGFFYQLFRRDVASA